MQLIHQAAAGDGRPHNFVSKASVPGKTMAWQGPEPFEVCYRRD
jgi:hypothetical protein